MLEHVYTYMPHDIICKTIYIELVLYQNMLLQILIAENDKVMLLAFSPFSWIDWSPPPARMTCRLSSWLIVVWRSGRHIWQRAARFCSTASSTFSPTSHPTSSCLWTCLSVWCVCCTTCVRLARASPAALSTMSLSSKTPTNYPTSHLSNISYSAQVAVNSIFAQDG